MKTQSAKAPGCPLPYKNALPVQKRRLCFPHPAGSCYTDRQAGKPPAFPPAALKVPVRLLLQYLPPDRSGRANINMPHKALHRSPRADSFVPHGSIPILLRFLFAAAIRSAPDTGGFRDSCHNRCSAFLQVSPPLSGYPFCFAAASDMPDTDA